MGSMGRYINYILGFDPDYVDAHQWEKDPVTRQIILGGLLTRGGLPALHEGGQEDAAQGTSAGRGGG